MQKAGRLFPVLLAIVISNLLIGCSASKTLTDVKSVTAKTPFDDAFVGISIVDAADMKPVMQMNADHYFSPASNTKLFVMQAALAAFEDSIPGWKYRDTRDTLYITPQGDPTFLHPDFKNQVFFDFLQRANKVIVLLLDEKPAFGRFGAGWGWNGWLNTYAAERSQMPVYGNLARLVSKGKQLELVPKIFPLSNPSGLQTSDVVFLHREELSNGFSLRPGKSPSVTRPFMTSGDSIPFQLLKDTLIGAGFKKDLLVQSGGDRSGMKTFFTASTDSVVRLMMHRSDNFIAEQLLLMVAKERLGAFNETEIRSKIMKEDLGSIIRKGRWADGSGLSRNNLFSPTEIVGLLALLEQQHGAERVAHLLPHGNEGTLRGLYLKYPDRIYGKTGTLTDHIALSGYFTALSGRRFYFSFLVNNQRSGIQEVRKGIESFLVNVIEEL